MHGGLRGCVPLYGWIPPRKQLQRGAILKDHRVCACGGDGLRLRFQRGHLGIQHDGIDGDIDLYPARVTKGNGLD
ncbi:hypothetical protein SDC9_141810 [bioreactor metagenome]|uniref:Uncharacterized protein n=1 Tax=bioreactor metagenome TaxID=1076179 RepID=A0A645E253_9ZZZZ